MFKKLKRLAPRKPASTNGIQTQGELCPPPSDPALGEIPEIRVQVEELSNFYDPVTPRPCMTCGPLTTCTEQPVPIEALFRSFDNGCSICSLFWKVYIQAGNLGPVHYVSTWSGNKGAFGVYLIKKRVEDGNEVAGETVAVVVLAADGERSPSPFPWLPNVIKSPFNRSQLRDIQMLSAWINDCQANHPSCQQSMHPKLPTRIIDVGSGTAQPFLKITHGEVGRYIALSHRWGALDSQLKMLITKRENIEDFCRMIPFESFPLTFRHAIEVSRSLGIQYLWIDSLCIVQDDLQDWEIEAARMGDIYENAYATLFAERANHCDDGLFQTVEDKSIATDWVREIESRNPQTNDQYWILASFRHSYYPNSLSPEEAFCLVDKPISQLQSRGWIMQEEILSRRKICFSRTELHWQCRSMSRCECGLKSLADERFTNDLTRNLLLTQRGDGSVTRGLSASGSNAGRTTDLNKSWKKLIGIYSRRTFTYERDRLSALAGAASKLGRSSQNYLAGIWREDAGDQLLWRGWNRNGAPCGRHEAYYAPTWSWASLRGGISFCSLSGSTISHSGENSPAPTQIWRIMDGSCQPSGENPMGPVSMGMLRIQSKIAPVFVDECEGPASDLKDNYGIFERRGIYEQNRNGKTYHLVLRSYIGAGKSTGGASHDTIISLDTKDDWKMFTGKKAQQCYYLIAQVGTITGATMSDETSRTMGLLIRESAIHQGYWERVCLVSPKGWWRDWRHLAEDREIILA
ncbi:uncharacterized protein BP5553_09208 [Venustampulla echinocandica]|uniref:Heterokaryon incompatibility domain-containing protein n=1 Tax=Venustampulla echinocandica TaxID=2656787 RepID=A0A370TC53_9HELO|nr:uncharacterized protein BP5553_09208 [Venustampulla echinocandica]RDL31806.1 hypothetical protein BP5553_09208 [Venustampulla echinocandica]